MAIRKKTKLQIEDKYTGSSWFELSKLLREYLQETKEEEIETNEILQVHKVRRTKLSTPKGL